jgi:hypothetical protein
MAVNNKMKQDQSCWAIFIVASSTKQCTGAPKIGVQHIMLYKIYE